MVNPTYIDYKFIIEGINSVSNAMAKNICKLQSDDTKRKH